MADLDMTLHDELMRYPYEVDVAERGPYFDGLVERWPVAELVAGIAAWRSDCLLPLLEATQESRALSDEGHRDISLVAWLSPADDRGEDEQDQVLGDLADYGLSTTLVSMGAAALHPARFEALERRLEGKDAVFAPLTTLRSQALDLLLARLMGLRVAILVPDPLSKAMGQGTMPQLMTVAQTASVMIVPRTTNLTFWTMASHAQLIDAERMGEGDELLKSVIGALSEPQRPGRRSTPVEKPKDPMAPLLKASMGGVAAGMAQLKFPPIIGGGSAEDQPVNDVPLDARALRNKIARLEEQLYEAKAQLEELEGE